MSVPPQQYQQYQQPPPPPPQRINTNALEDSADIYPDERGRTWVGQIACAVLATIGCAFGIACIIYTASANVCNTGGPGDTEIGYYPSLFLEENPPNCILECQDACVNAYVEGAEIRRNCQVCFDKCTHPWDKNIDNCRDHDECNQPVCLEDDCIFNYCRPLAVCFEGCAGPCIKECEDDAYVAVWTGMTALCCVLLAFFLPLCIAGAKQIKMACFVFLGLLFWIPALVLAIDAFRLNLDGEGWGLMDMDVLGRSVTPNYMPGVILCLGLAACCCMLIAYYTPREVWYSGKTGDQARKERKERYEAIKEAQKPQPDPQAIANYEHQKAQEREPHFIAPQSVPVMAPAMSAMPQYGGPSAMSAAPGYGPPGSMSVAPQYPHAASVAPMNSGATFLQELGREPQRQMPDPHQSLNGSLMGPAPSVAPPHTAPPIPGSVPPQAAPYMPSPNMQAHDVTLGLRFKADRLTEEPVVTQVLPGKSGYQQGVEEGDIVLSIGEVPPGGVPAPNMKSVYRNTQLGVSGPTLDQWIGEVRNGAAGTVIRFRLRRVREKNAEYTVDLVRSALAPGVNTTMSP